MAELVISIIALTVSALVAWHALAARSHVHAQIVRSFDPTDDGQYRFRGDEVIVYNTGRADAVLVSVDVVHGPNDFRSPGSDTFPDMPITLPAQSATRAYFPAGLADQHGGMKRGYRVQYFGTRWFGQSTEPKSFVVRAKLLRPSA